MELKLFSLIAGGNGASTSLGGMSRGDVLKPILCGALSIERAVLASCDRPLILRLLKSRPLHRPKVAPIKTVEVHLASRPPSK